MLPELCDATLAVLAALWETISATAEAAPHLLLLACCAAWIGGFLVLRR
jgi:hypothetical protein